MKRSLAHLDREGCRVEFEASLARMLSRDEALQPFVVLEHAPTATFVQCCGSQSRYLLLDVPQLEGYQQEFKDRAPSTLMLAGSMAFAILRSLASTSLEPKDLRLTEHPDDAAAPSS